MEMDLLHNPFYVLRATSRDSQHRIMELAEEGSLLADPDICQNARETLTHPRKRISAEVAWLPGVDPEQVIEILLLLEASAGNRSYTGHPTSITAALFHLPYTETSNIADEVLALLKLSDEHAFREKKLQPIKHSHKINTLMEISEFLGINTLPLITHANLAAARMSRLPVYTADEVSAWIIAIAQTFEWLNPESVCETLNADRREAGFPVITDIPAVATEIKKRRYHYQQVIKSVLNNMPTAKERLNAIRMIVNSTAINHSKNRKPLLIEDTVDAYAVKAEPILENEEMNIETRDQELRHAAETKEDDTNFPLMVDKLIYSVRNWHDMAQPILSEKKRKGFKDDASHRVAMDVRRLAIYLFKEHDKLQISQQILKMLQEVFAELPTIVEHIDSDLEMLNKIAEKRKPKKTSQPDSHQQAAYSAATGQKEHFK